MEFKKLLSLGVSFFSVASVASVAAVAISRQGAASFFGNRVLAYQVNKTITLDRNTQVTTGSYEGASMGYAYHIAGDENHSPIGFFEEADSSTTVSFGSVTGEDYFMKFSLNSDTYYSMWIGFNNITSATFTYSVMDEQLIQHIDEISLACDMEEFDVDDAKAWFCPTREWKNPRTLVRPEGSGPKNFIHFFFSNFQYYYRITIQSIVVNWSC